MWLKTVYWSLSKFIIPKKMFVISLLKNLYRWHQYPIQMYFKFIRCNL